MEIGWKSKGTGRGRGRREEVTYDNKQGKVNILQFNSSQWEENFKIISNFSTII
jgi:hypothetical protein